MMRLADVGEKEELGGVRIMLAGGLAGSAGWTSNRGFDVRRPKL